MLFAVENEVGDVLPRLFKLFEGTDLSRRELHAMNMRMRMHTRTTKVNKSQQNEKKKKQKTKPWKNKNKNKPSLTASEMASLALRRILNMLMMGSAVCFELFVVLLFVWRLSSLA